ncbi:hypothetical protein GCM10027047_39000 [Rhodococcus aerolatus]
MPTATRALTPPDKGLAPGALGLTTATVVGVASTAPAYSLAATLGLVVAGVGVQAPVVVVLAFLPILGVALAYRELNALEPDCGTTFTWATRAFGPWVGWLGGWAIVAADVLVMASLAQVAGQYTFLLAGAEGIGRDASGPGVLAVGLAFIVAMTALCLRGTELSARLQAVLLAVEVVALALFAVVALVRVATGSAGEAALTPSWSWFDPTAIAPGALVPATLLMVFIYWGWDSALSVNEETTDRHRVPGLAAVVSTVALVSVYVLVTVAAQAFAGVGETGTGLANPGNADDVLSVLGAAVFGDGPLGRLAVGLLLLMVLTSAAACTQTTILPTARTTLAMGVHRALPDTFARVHPRWATPTTSTVAFGAVSVVGYVVMNEVSDGAVVVDAVSAVSLAVGVYYGLTGLACAWLFRRTLLRSPRHLLLRGVAPLLGGGVLLGAVVVTAVTSWGPGAGETSWTLPFPPHWQVGGVFLLGVGSLLLGLPLAWAARRHRPGFFRGEVLARGLPAGAVGPD